MTDNVENLIVEHLKALRSELADVKADTSEIRQRLASHDSSIIALHRNDVHVMEESARQQVTLDKLLERIQRLEKRLDLS
ncbi:MAG: hypothetical protein U1E95_13490 [Rubrivivax sp.]